jgi:hypothetical protein
MGDIRKYFYLILKINGLFLAVFFSAILLYSVFHSTINSRFRTKLLEEFGMSRISALLNADFVDEDMYSGSAFRRSIMPDHMTVVRWVQECIGLQPGERPPGPINAYFEIPSRSMNSGYTERNILPPHIRPINSIEKAFLQLSGTLVEQRTSLNDVVTSSYFYWQLATILTIGIGMITTILVGVSSTEFGRGDGQQQRIIRLMAIVFPALGTASAAIIGFYSPQAQWGQSSRTLTSVSSLHSQISQAIWAAPCSGPNASAKDLGDLRALFSQWTKRYNDIQTVSISSAPTVSAQTDAPLSGKEPGSTGKAAEASSALNAPGAGAAVGPVEPETGTGTGTSNHAPQ